MTSEMKLKTDEFRKDGLGYSRTVNSLCKQEKQLHVLSMDRKKCTSRLDRKSQLRKIVPSYLPDVPLLSISPHQPVAGRHVAELPLFGGA